MATETNIVRIFVDFCQRIRKAKVDEEQTMVSAWKLFNKFQHNLAMLDLELLTTICEQGEELRQMELDGKIKVNQLVDAVFPAYMPKKAEQPQKEEEPEAAPVEESVEAEPEEELEHEPEESEPEPIPTKPVEEKTEDELWIPIDWIDKIPVDKYSIDPHGHIRNNRQNAPVLPFMKNGQLSVKLTGVIRAGKKNPVSTTVPINNLLEIVFRKMQQAAKKKADTAELQKAKAALSGIKTPQRNFKGRYRLEDMTVPMKPLAPPVKDEPEKIGPIPLAEGYPDFARIDFVPTVPPDKYIIYQDGSVVNKQTGRTLTIKTSTSGQPRYCLLGEDNYRAYRTISYLLICAFAKDRAKAQAILNSNMKPKLIDQNGPLHLSNIDMEYYS